MPLPAATLGSPRLHLRRTDSTNERVRVLAAAGAPHGTLVTAAEQTAGRGRQGRRWSAPAGSALLMSLLLRWPNRGFSPEASVSPLRQSECLPNRSQSSVPRLRSPALLPLVAAVAVCDAIEQVKPRERPQIKWPNDIVLERQPVAPPGPSEPQAPQRGRSTSAQAAVPSSLAKLAGILIEGRPQEQWAVLGIGVNVAVRVEELPEELREHAASLTLPVETVEPLLARLLEAVERWLGEPPTAVLDAWRSRDALRGREVSWSGGSGRAGGVDDGGRLVVELGEGHEVALEAGEVHLGLGGEVR
jgi:BirA family biotin operon repressor/biotin-[acetyl-CoA-carboxylase] ligase